MSDRSPRRRRRQRVSRTAVRPAGATLVDIVDSLIGSGVSLDGEVILGLADVDLIYLRLSALLSAADRLLGVPARARTRRKPRAR